MKFSLKELTLTGILLAITIPAAAQSPAPPADCARAGAHVGWLGITGLRAPQLSVRQGETADDFAVWFGQEPEILAVEGPAAGRLRPGDVITAVDDLLITTRAGGARLTRPTPGRAVTMTVRREGREVRIEVKAWAVCPEDALLPTLPPAPKPPRPALAPSPPEYPEPPETPAPAPRPPAAMVAPSAPSAPSAPVPPAPALAPAPPMPPEPPMAASWFGIGFECRKCGHREDETGRTYFFSSPPSVFSVDSGSPAERAGLRRGDVLTHVDGYPITTDEGANRFFAIEPGASVVFAYERDGVSGEATVRGEERPVRGTLARAPRPVAEHLRYAGSLGGVDLEVRGLDSVHVTVDEAEGTIVIRTRDAVVRLTQAGGP